LGYVLIGAAGGLVAIRPVACRRFLLDSIRIRARELRWFASYVPFLLRPSRNRIGKHEGHFDPGQRLFNVVVLATLVILAVTGILMSFPQYLAAATYAWSLRLHRAATLLLAAAVVGHVAVASGILSGYRGVWRAMHADGRVHRDLAERLWPRWADDEPS
jgi:formate dehydrogenase subunit gamma